MYPTPNIIIAGDFNLPHAIWPEGSPNGGASKPEKQMLHLLKDFGNEFFLTQQINQPTHREGNILDLVFTNYSEQIHSYRCFETLRSVSHHSIVEIATTYQGSGVTDDEEVRQELSFFDRLNFFNEKADWDAIRNELEGYNWTLEFRDLSTEKILDRLYSVCYSICRDFIPEKKRHSNKGTSTIPKERKNLMRRRRRANLLLLKITSPSKQQRLKKELIDIQIKLQTSYRNMAKEREDKAIKSIKKKFEVLFQLC